MSLPADDKSLLDSVFGKAENGEQGSGLPNSGISGEQTDPKGGNLEGQEEEEQEQDPNVEGEEDEGTPEGEQEPEKEQGAEISAEDLARFAGVLGVDEEELVLQDGQLHVRTKIDGEVGEVSLSDLRKGYQKDSSLTRKQQKFQQEQGEWQKAREQQQQQLQQTAQVVTAVLQSEHQALQKEIQDSNLDKLRVTDPAEYAAKIADFQRKDAVLRQKFQGVQTHLQQHQQQQMAEAQDRWNKTLQEQRNLLRDKMGWDSDEKALSGGQQIQEYLIQKAGFAPEDLAQFVDHRAAVVADKARKWDELQSRSRKAKDKLQAAPSRVAAPGAAPRAGRPTDLKALKARASKSKDVGSPESLAYLLAAGKKTRR